MAKTAAERQREQRAHLKSNEENYSKYLEKEWNQKKKARDTQKEQMSPTKKRAPPRRFSCEYIRTFTPSTGRSYMNSAFLIKLRVVYYVAATLSRCWSTIEFFLKILFLAQLVFGTYFKKNLW